MKTRIEVKSRQGTDSRGEVIKGKVLGLMEEGAIPKGDISSIEIVDAYSMEREELPQEHLAAAAAMVTNPVTQENSVGTNFCCSDGFMPDQVIEIGFKPGVTDNVANTVRQGLEAKLGIPFADGESVHSSQVILIRGSLSREVAVGIGEALANPLIQNIDVLSGGEFYERGIGAHIPKVKLEDDPTYCSVPLSTMDAVTLKRVAKKGVIDPKTGEHRGPLGLDIDDDGNKNVPPIHTIRDHFIKEGRNPTDAELECLAQTWSEHCGHKTFAASLDRGTDDAVPQGLLKTYIKGATEEIRRRWAEQGKEDFLLSLFHDNAGVVKFDDDYALVDKAETHNSPSALDPYGGALTGIVGVNRDPKGTGLGAMPIWNGWWFCLDDPKVRRVLFKGKKDDGTLTQKMLSPRALLDGIVDGVKDGGNKSGIPTVFGGTTHHAHYTGKPLVFVRTTGLMPLESAGRNTWEKKAQPGDYVVMMGGRVGLDGIHGATFSSEAMDAGSPATAVQIGDPITQKKMSDALMKEIRDQGLYSSITDNGAGGLSCSVYEMATECGGATIDIDKVPLKYPGMRPDEILISESQERMTLSVPPEKWDKLKSICDKHGVEATVLGEFNDSGRAVATFRGDDVLDLDLDFFQDGLPQMNLRTTFTPELYVHEEPVFDDPDDLTQDLLGMLGRLNICSKGYIHEQYDHEVQGGSVIKPMVGEGKVDSQATVNRPILDSMRGAVLTQAINPRYSFIDTGAMAACAIDTAVRNMVATGADLEHMSLMDNFCWCSSDEPERLGQLKRAAKAAYDTAVAHGTPFISGKDSMFNTFKGFDADGNPMKIDVPPTLMVSGLSVVEDVQKCQTPDAKVAGDLVYVIGETRDETGGSEYLAMKGEQDPERQREYIGNKVPQVDAEKTRQAYAAVSGAVRDGLVASCASVSIGGLGVALAKTAIGGQLGMEVDVRKLELDCLLSGEVQRMDTLLFGSESQGRFVATIDPAKRDAFEAALEGVKLSYVGRVTGSSEFVVKYGDEETFIRTTLDDMTESYRAPFRGY